MRKEVDFIGDVEIPVDALYGIHSVRARENFPDNALFNEKWFRAVGVVKLACYQAYRKFKTAALENYDPEKLPLTFIDDKKIAAMQRAAEEISHGRYFDQFIVPAMQGGAGTSINMNVNEIIANATLVQLGLQPGQYDEIDPFEQANVFQSTNDVIPTALKVAAMSLLEELEEVINHFRHQIEAKEGKNRNRLRQAYTQMQEAIPSSYDKLFSTYNNALSRDWWRVSKCFERIKEVNLGGGAIGTGLAIPRFFIMQVVNELQQITGLPVTRSENLLDTTANLDSLVEVHATLKAHAVNLEKMAADFRLLAADVMNNRELMIPQRQVGSSIMPGKVNPVIPEFVISSVHKVYANDQLVSQLCGQGCLELNAYLPTIGHALLESIQLLIAVDKTFADNLVKGVNISSQTSDISPVYSNPSITTALIPYIGYHGAAEMAHYMKHHKKNVFFTNSVLKCMDEILIQQVLSDDALLKMGYSLKDLIK
ncbi:aspartate ammonia-lyase [Marinilabiliaceae bacterium JC017]|nr:aspartate ammonia-lyase [Marinilabiliaceae bacterium JC017]